MYSHNVSLLFFVYIKALFLSAITRDLVDAFVNTGVLHHSYFAK